MATVQSYVTPRHLYRYRPLTDLDSEMRTIERGHLYCATYKSMNDPMEGFYSSSKLLRESPDVEAVRREILAGKRSIGICSFSEVYNHELMWAHYAMRFTGMCIAYDFFKLQKHLGENVNFSRVFYNEEAPSVGRTRLPRDFNEIAKMILSYKSYRWHYEREWRVFGEPGELNYTNLRCVSRVYIGARSSLEDRREVANRLRVLGIPVHIQKLDRYKMSFELQRANRQSKKASLISSAV